MYTKILKPEIMSTMLPEGFPADKLSQPQYKMVVEKDVFVTMRDGVRVAVRRLPARRRRASSRASTPPRLPEGPRTTCRRCPPSTCARPTRSSGSSSAATCYVNHDIRGSGKSVEGSGAGFSQEEQNDHYDVIEWIAASPGAPARWA